MYVVKTRNDTYILETKKELLSFLKKNISRFEYITIEYLFGIMLEILNNTINSEVIDILLKMSEYSAVNNIALYRNNELAINNLVFEKWSIDSLRKLLKYLKLDYYDPKKIFQLDWKFIFRDLKDLLNFLEDSYLCVSNTNNNHYIIDLRKHISEDSIISVNSDTFKIQEIVYGEKWKIILDEFGTEYFYIIGGRDDFLNKISTLLCSIQKFNLDIVKKHIIKYLAKQQKNTFTIDILDELSNYINIVMKF